MMDPNSTRTAYPSDPTETQWRQIEPLLPDEKPHGRHRETNLREVVSAINYRDQTDCPWRMLPDDFPAWGTVYSYYRRWNLTGVLSKLRKILQQHPAPQTPETPIHSPPPTEQSA